MIKTINEIPCYEAVLFDENSGIFKVSLVSNPAVKSNFLKFKENQEMKYSVIDEEQRIILGCIMRCDYPIYRCDEQNGEYYISFNRETIEEMATKWFYDYTFNAINLQHTEGTEQGGLFLMQSFIKDSEKGINPKGFEDISDGSLFAQYRVDNDEVWADIKAGKYVGFSLEGRFGVEPQMVEDEPQIIDSIEDLLKYFK